MVTKKCNCARNKSSWGKTVTKKIYCARNKSSGGETVTKNAVVED